MEMTKKTDIVRDIHPKSLLYKSNTTVQEFDSKEDLLEYIKANPNKKYDTTQFIKNTKNYELDEAATTLVINNVRNNLIKRGIITGTIYEGYKYDIEGDIIDYAELATGNPACMMKPIKKYDKYFYELYINMSIPAFVKEKTIIEGAIKLAETIKALEELNVEIKVNIVLYSQGMFNDRSNYLFVMPLISHLEYKDHKLLLPYVDGEFLRKALFTVMTNNGDTNWSLGNATKLDNTVNMWELDEVELAEKIIGDLGL
jgi:hypothetical protein